MTKPFHKFPRTPHLFWLGAGTARDDKIMKPEAAAEFVAGELVVEEKVDGANLGISLGVDGRLRAQSRGDYLTPGRCHAQWNPLWPWLAAHRQGLEEGLQGGPFLLYGEWCHALHTVPYDALPDWFLGFDLLELTTGKFWAVDRRNEWFKCQGIVPAPEIARGRFSQTQLPALLASSRVGQTPMEGLYLRREQAGYLSGRAKIVNPTFKQRIEQHWARRPVIPNRLYCPVVGGGVPVSCTR